MEYIVYGIGTTIIGIIVLVFLNFFIKLVSGKLDDESKAREIKRINKHNASVEFDELDYEIWKLRHKDEIDKM